MPGAGKTSVGRALARRLGGTFDDTDRIAEDSTGRSVAQIFADDGEAAFRAVETNALRVALERARGSAVPGVIALGGGVPTVAENRAMLAAEAWVVHLVASPMTARRRLSGDRSRPLLADGFGAWEKLWAARAEDYRAVGDLELSVDGQTVPQLVSAIILAAKASGAIDASRATKGNTL